MSLIKRRNQPTFQCSNQLYGCHLRFVHVYVCGSPVVEKTTFLLTSSLLCHNKVRSELNMQRKLSGRHMQKLSLGGTIGVCLFMGALATIKWTGPSVLMSYIMSGLFLYLIMRACGEMLYVYPATGSLSKLSRVYMHPLLCYLTAWSNIFQLLLDCMSEKLSM